MINKVTLIGRVGKDAEERVTDDSRMILTFSLATSENFKDGSGEWQQRTEWHNIVAFGNVGKYAKNLAIKGRLLYLEGKINSRKYTDKNGVERIYYSIIAGAVKSLEKKESQESSAKQFAQNTGLPF